MTLMSKDIRVIMACDKIQLDPFDYAVTHIYPVNYQGFTLAVTPQ